MRVDAHHHFWKISRGDYGWLTPDMVALYQDYGPEELMPHLSATDMNATVLVQAAPTVEETKFLLKIAEDVAWVKAVVGWVDFEDTDAAAQIHYLSKAPWFKGLRPMLQDIRDVSWILRQKFDPVFAAMEACNLRLDALIEPRHLDVLNFFAISHPNLKSVIDHGAKPKISTGEFDEWARKMTTLAQHENVFCKLSGLWTEAGGDITAETVLPYVSHLLECFGPTRLMWGSDWPVLKLAGDYEAWFEQSRNLLMHLKPSDQEAIFGTTARQFYDF